MGAWVRVPPGRRCGRGSIFPIGGVSRVVHAARPEARRRRALQLWAFALKKSGRACSAGAGARRWSVSLRGAGVGGGASSRSAASRVWCTWHGLPDRQRLACGARSMAGGMPEVWPTAGGVRAGLGGCLGTRPSGARDAAQPEAHAGGVPYRGQWCTRHGRRHAGGVPYRGQRESGPGWVPECASLRGARRWSASLRGAGGARPSGVRDATWPGARRRRALQRAGGEPGSASLRGAGGAPLGARPSGARAGRVPPGCETRHGLQRAA